MSLSITGGRFNGSVLRTPSGADLTRPTSGKVRQALFNRLREHIEGADFLDLYAGSGAVGLEALSRGCRRAVLVENHPAAFRVLEANCRLLLARGAAPETLEWTRQEARAFCKNAGKKTDDPAGGEPVRFGVAFADPPFGQDFSGLPELLLPLLAPGGAAVIQFPTRNPPDWAGRAEKIAAYGESSLAFFSAE